MHMLSGRPFALSTRAQWSCCRWAIVLVLVYSVSGRNALNIDEWDFIVVGAGASGCAAAAGLAEDGSRVLVSEAGPPTAWDFGGRDQKDYFTKFGGDTEVTLHDVPGEAFGLQMNPNYFWDTVPWGAQGKGVGGSGMVNEGVSLIPSPEDFDSWPQGWKYTDLEPFYREVLERTHVTPNMSIDGNLYLQTTGNILNDVLTEHLGFTEAPLNADPYNRVNISSLSEHYVKGGQRHESCLAYLLPELHKRANIRLRSNAEVRRILFSGVGKARGVELEGGEEIVLGEYGKVIMASGPLNTPKLLMSSGIGSESELERLDRNGMVLNPKELWVVNEAVGACIHDHVGSLVPVRVPEELRMGVRLQNPINDLQAQADYLMNRTNFLTQFGFQRLGFLTMPGRSAPDFEVAVLSKTLDPNTATCDSCSLIFIMGLFPRARDRLRIQTPDLNCDCSPLTCKTGDFCLPNLYLADEEDREETKWALTTVVRAMEKKGIEVLGMDTTDDGLADFVDNNPGARANCRHYAGTCTLGQCTDCDLKLVGTENVYVVDSSTFPTPLRAHNVITAIAVGRKAVHHVKW